MQLNRECSSRCWILPVVSLLLLAAVGCTSRRATTDQEDNLDQSTRATNPSELQPIGGTYCVETITQGPPPAAPIHFSNNVNDSNGSSKDF